MGGGQELPVEQTNYKKGNTDKNETSWDGNLSEKDCDRVKSLETTFLQRMVLIRIQSLITLDNLNSR